ncbi:MAG: CPBP family intramembrane metalloprotease [Thaumarchaeota archaeon]|nr:CPBP family intramembrane metalloprotease [Nitrososphaerota archaeon]
MQRKLDDIALLIIALLLLVLMIASYPLGAFAFYYGNLGTTYTPASISEKLFVFIFGLPVAIPVNVSFSDAFAASLLLYAIMFVISAIWPRAPIASVLKGRSKTLENPLIAVAVTFSAMLVGISSLVRLQEMVGISSGGLEDADQLLLFIQATLAPFREEIGFRLSIIGVFASLVAFSNGGGVSSLHCLFLPKKLLNLVKSRRYSTALWSVNIASAFYFGISHLIYEPGVWQIGKVSESIVAGLAMGWIYIEYGFFAAVLLHWAFNYFITAIELFEVSFGSLGITSIATYLTILLAVAYLISYGSSIIRSEEHQK